VDHVPGHVVCPFEHLRSDVDKECIRGPSSKDHYFCRGMVHQEERHCCSGSDGSVPNFVRVKAERSKTPEETACVSKQVSDEGVTNLEGLTVESYRAHRGLLGPVGDC
jgi:hypothetical protein